MKKHSEVATQAKNDAKALVAEMGAAGLRFVSITAAHSHAGMADVLVTCATEADTQAVRAWGQKTGREIETRVA